MRREVKANELTDVDVQFVSLVKRGANRIPFRITKEDNPMLDFVKLFQKSDDAAAKAARAALVDKIKKEEAAAAASAAQASTDAAAALVNAQELLKAAGFTVMVAEGQPQTSTPAASAAVAADADKGAKVKKDEEDAAAIAAKEAEIEAAKAGVTKAEGELADLKKKASPEALAAGVNKSKNKQTQTGDGVAAANGSGPGGDGEDEDISKKPVVGNDPKTGPTETIVHKLEAGQVALAKSLGELTALFKTSLEGLTAEISTVKAKVAKAESALTGSVLGSAQDDPPPANVRKSAGGVPPLLDTSMPGSR